MPFNLSDLNAPQWDALATLLPGGALVSKGIRRGSNKLSEALEKELGEVETRIYDIRNRYFNPKDRYESQWTPKATRQRDMEELAELEKRKAGLLLRERGLSDYGIDF